MNTLKHNILLLFLLIIGMNLGGCDSGRKAEKTWQLDSEGVLAASISNTGNYVLLGTDSGKANLWDIRKKEKSLLYAWQHQPDDSGAIIAVDLSYDDKFALTAEENSMVWWRVDDGKILGYWKLDGIKSIAISKDGQYAVVGFRDSAEYFSLRRSKTVFKLEHPDFVKTVAISDDGRYAITGSDNAEARLWSLKNGELLHSWKYKTKLFSVLLSPDGEYAMTNAVLGETKIWRTKSGKRVHSLPPKRVTLSAVAFNSTGKKLATVRMTPRIDLWSLKSGKRLNSWVPKKEDKWAANLATIYAVGFTNKDKNIISVSSNGFVQSWKSK